MKGIRRSHVSWVPGILVCLPIILFLVLAATPVLAKKPAVLQGTDISTESKSDPRTRQLRALLKDFTKKDELPGASLLIAQHGRVVFREAYGWADAGSKKPFTVDTLVLTASATKPLSASAVMLLVDQRKISLDDKISRYLPEFGKLKTAGSEAYSHSPTIRQLLSHTSGLFGLDDATKTGMRAVRDFTLTLEESVNIIAKENLTSEPGVRFNYGGANYQVAARIAELVTGKPFDVHMRESLFKPLKMDASYFKPDQGQETINVAMPYNFTQEKGLVPIPAYGPDPNRKLVLASGGLYSSLNDLAVFLQMHLNGGSYGGSKILTPAAVKEMQKMQTGNLKEHYGLGWFIDRVKPNGQTLSVNHHGLLGAYLWIDKDRDLVGVFLASSIWPAQNEIHKSLHGKVLELFSPAR